MKQPLPFSSLAFCCAFLLLPAFCSAQKNLEEVFSSLYVLTKDCQLQDDTAWSYRNDDDTSSVFYFSGQFHRKAADSFCFGAALVNVFEQEDPVDGLKHLMISGCNPELSFCRIDRFGFWRGRYASEATGISTAVIYFDELGFRIIGMEEKGRLAFSKRFIALKTVPAKYRFVFEKRK